LIEAVADELRTTLSADAVVLAATDPDTLLGLGAGVVQGMPPSACAPFWEYEFEVPDFNQFSVVAPTDSRLPSGGGQTVGGLVNVVPTKFGQTNNLLTFADNYGKQSESWQGVDVSVNARLRGGVLAQGGISTGRRLTDACEIRAALPKAFFLVPGYGAQGGKAEDLKACFNADGLGAIVNSSRGIIAAWEKDPYKGLAWEKAVEKAVIDMKADINGALGV